MMQSKSAHDEEQVEQWFIFSTEAEHNRFTLLEQAYIGGYETHYSIPPETVIIIQEQVKEYVTQGI